MPVSGFLFSQDFSSVDAKLRLIKLSFFDFALMLLHFYSFLKLPELHELMIEAASMLNIDAPDLYLRQSPVPNAYTLAISGKKPFVVVHTSLVELLSRKELQVCIQSNK